MKKFLPILFIFSITTLHTFAQNKASVQKILNHTLSSGYTQNLITILAGDEMQGRETGKPGFDKAANFVISELEKMKVQSFVNSNYKIPFVHGNSTNFYNVVGVIKSKKAINAPIILSAHLDHLGINKEESKGKDTIYNGANDDATGVTAVLQIARFLSQFSFDRDIILAFFGGEEKGLLGSKALANRLKAQNINLAYMINFEMIGNAMQNAVNTAYLTGFDLSNMAEKLNKSAENPFIIKDAIDEKYKLFTRSDNYSFYQIYKVPAHTLSTFDFPKENDYHQVTDEVENLDIENMNSIIKKTAYGIYNLLKENSKIEMKEVEE